MNEHRSSLVLLRDAITAQPPGLPRTELALGILAFLNSAGCDILCRPAGGQQSSRPMRLTWVGDHHCRDLSYAEAEAHHLQEAARLAGATDPGQQRRQAEHLHQAWRNREWGQRQAASRRDQG